MISEQHLRDILGAVGRDDLMIARHWIAGVVRARLRQVCRDQAGTPAERMVAAVGAAVEDLVCVGFACASLAAAERSGPAPVEEPDQVRLPDAHQPADVPHS